MDPQTQVLLQIVQLPTVALLALAVYKLYIDARADRLLAANERAAMMDRLQQVYDRLLTVQQAVGTKDRPPTP